MPVIRHGLSGERPYALLMPSQLHEVLLQLFRNRPALAPELLRDALHQELPSYTSVTIDSADLSEIQPAECRADLVVLLLDGVPCSASSLKCSSRPTRASSTSGRCMSRVCARGWNVRSACW